MKSGGMCWTMTIPGVLAGNPASSCWSAWTPPVLMPTTMIRSLAPACRE